MSFCQPIGQALALLFRLIKKGAEFVEWLTDADEGYGVSFSINSGELAEKLGGNAVTHEVFNVGNRIGHALGFLQSPDRQKPLFDIEPQEG